MELLQGIEEGISKENFVDSNRKIMVADSLIKLNNLNFP